MSPAFFYLIKEHIHYCIKKLVTNFRKPLEVGLKLSIMLRHLAIGEIHRSLQYHWLVGQNTICKFIPKVCQAILAGFQNWKKVEEKFRTRLNVPHVLGALDRKHIALEKPKNSGSEYYNYKGFFPRAASPGQCKIQIPLSRCRVKWIFIRCINI